MPAADEETSDGDTSATETIPALKPGQQLDVVMQLCDVISLEAGDFNADSTEPIA